MLRIHASFHKCLTMYYITIMDRLFNWQPYRVNYKHFESNEGEFYNTVHQYKLASTNGFAINLDCLNDDFRIVRFVRDPRDLIVSGYFYHKRGAEPWFRFQNPSNRYWQPINARVPTGMPAGCSYAEYLNTLSLEQGLLAEMEWRSAQFDSIRQWQQDERIKLFKYENIIGNEHAIFQQIFDFYQLSYVQKRIGLMLVNQHAYRNKRHNQHVRDPRPGQWQQHFTPEVAQRFNQQYGDILDLLEY